METQNTESTVSTNINDPISRILINKTKTNTNKSSLFIGILVGILASFIICIVLVFGTNLFKDTIISNGNNLNTVTTIPTTTTTPDKTVPDYKKGDFAQYNPEVKVVDAIQFTKADGKSLDLTKANVNDMKIAGQVIAFSLEKFNQNNTVTFDREVTDSEGGTGSFVVDFVKGKFSRELKKEASLVWGSGYVENSVKQIVITPNDTETKIGRGISLDEILFYNSLSFEQMITACIQGKIYVNGFTSTMTSKQVDISANLKGIEYIYDFKTIEATTLLPFVQLIYADMGRDSYQISVRIGEDGNLYYISLPAGYGEDILKNFVYDKEVVID
jgi:hypothetical protein